MSNTVKKAIIALRMSLLIKSFSFLPRLIDTQAANQHSLIHVQANIPPTALSVKLRVSPLELMQTLNFAVACHNSSTHFTGVVPLCKKNHTNPCKSLSCCVDK